MFQCCGSFLLPVQFSRECTNVAPLACCPERSLLCCSAPFDRDAAGDGVSSIKRNCAQEMSVAAATKVGTQRCRISSSSYGGTWSLHSSSSSSRVGIHVCSGVHTTFFAGPCPQFLLVEANTRRLVSVTPRRRTVPRYRTRSIPCSFRADPERKPNCGATRNTTRLRAKLWLQPSKFGNQDI